MRRWGRRGMLLFVVRTVGGAGVLLASAGVARADDPPAAAAPAAQAPTPEGVADAFLAAFRAEDAKAMSDVALAGGPIWRASRNRIYQYRVASSGCGQTAHITQVSFGV